MIGKQRDIQKSATPNKLARRKIGASEWVGGRLTMPVYITESEPYRPEVMLWLELPGDLIVGSVMIDPKQPAVSFAQTLLDAMRSPMVGPPRSPRRIRVADAALAAEARQAAPDAKVVIAPTPELDHILELMTESESFGVDEDESYFEDGRVSANSVESLFRAAKALYVAAPWKHADDGQVLRLDIPALGIKASCISIIGALEESVGFIIFPSLAGFDRFLDAMSTMEASGELDGPIDLGSTMLSLNFDRGADLPATMRREAATYGWPVAGPKAYPFAQHRDRDGMLRPLTEHDVQVLAACATSLATFFIKHGELFVRESFEPICESFVDEHNVEVRITAPYEAGHLFAVNDSKAVRNAGVKPAVGRNAPCPCGSGKKYKKCCLRKDEARAQPEPPPATVHDMDRRLVDRMMRLAMTRFGDSCLELIDDFDDEAVGQLLVVWAAFHVDVEGKPIVDWFLEAEQASLSVTERRWLEAQRVSWLSVWEVVAVEPGTSITLEDLLTGEQRTVEETLASHSLLRRNAILARVVDFDDVSVLCGTHPTSLPPVSVAEVTRRVRGRLRRKRAIPVDRLREEKTGLYLIDRWEEGVDELDDHRGILPELHDSDDDEGPVAGEPFSAFESVEANQLMLTFKKQHYADWIDQPLPALQGRTPREAVSTKTGRERVELLLKDCEYHEARMPEGQRYDFSHLRVELGLRM